MASACMHACHFRQTMWGASETLLLYFATYCSDHTIVKLLLYLKKHALQDDAKVLGV